MSPLLRASERLYFQAESEYEEDIFSGAIGTRTAITDRLLSGSTDLGQLMMPETESIMGA